MKVGLLVLNAVQERSTRALLTGELESSGHRVYEVCTCTQAHLLLTNGFKPDIIIIDSIAADSPADWHELINIAPLGKTWLVIGNIGGISRHNAYKLGVRNFLEFPFTQEGIASIPRQIDHPNLSTVNAIATRPARADTFNTGSITNVAGSRFLEELGEGRFFLASSHKMRQIYGQIEMLADTDVNVLILGESGTGKDVVARLIHQRSRRNKRTFLKLNCAAMPPDLLESELFGHKQGAFTGAIKDQPGKFEQANGGTLFLDEIGEMGVQLQAKLLHVLEDGQFSRLGAQTYTKIDVRVIAATNVHMEDALLQGKFREDLYYRLGVITITLPPLRERREDIPHLIEETLRRTSADMNGGRAINFSSRLLDVALRYDWPGNVRELRNFITRTIIMQDWDTALQQLEIKISARNAPVEPQRAADACLPTTGMKTFVRDIMGRVEAEVIQEALERFGWNRRRAAESLNISYRGLLYKIQQHRLVPSASEDLSRRFRHLTHSADEDRALSRKSTWCDINNLSRIEKMKLG